MCSCDAGSNPARHTVFICRGIVQLVEHWSPKPDVSSSSLAAPANSGITKDAAKAYLSQGWPFRDDVWVSHIGNIGKTHSFAHVAELADAADSKSLAGNSVRVQVPSAALYASVAQLESARDIDGSAKTSIS